VEKEIIHDNIKETMEEIFGEIRVVVT